MQDDETGSERGDREPAGPGVPGGGAARGGAFGSTAYGDARYGDAGDGSTAYRDARDRGPWDRDTRYGDAGDGSTAYRDARDRDPRDRDTRYGDAGDGRTAYGHAGDGRTPYGDAGNRDAVDGSTAFADAGNADVADGSIAYEDARDRYAGYGDGIAGPPGGYGEWGGVPGGYGAIPPPPRRRKRGRVTVYTLVAVLAAGLGAGAALGLDTHATSSTGTGISSNDVPGPPANARAGTGSLNVLSVEGKVEPGVVDIDAAIQYSGGTSSEGTGMIINSDGLVLTNNHVINGAQIVKVTVAATGRQYTATVLGYDDTQDVALLRIRDASGLKAVSVGNSSDVTLGMPVLALGNAQGEGGRPKAARGIINSLDKTISPTDESTGATETLHGMLQTTADIVSGDSGGPLANAAGQVIGMDTANATSSQGSSSVLGYAIPINTALSVARQIAQKQAGGNIQIGVTGFLGVLVPQSASSKPRQEAQQQRQQEQQQGGPPSPARRCITNDADMSVPSVIAPASAGALVDGVLCGTAAASAGLASGDVITSVNGQDVTTPGSLTTIMGKYHPGDRVTVHWVTPGGQRKTGTLTLGAAPAR